MFLHDTKEHISTEEMMEVADHVLGHQSPARFSVAALQNSLQLINGVLLQSINFLFNYSCYDCARDRSRQRPTLACQNKMEKRLNTSEIVYSDVARLNRRQYFPGS